MAPLASRDDLTQYCLRRLGSPVIEINVDDDQVSDRLDDALQWWTEYHFDGVERMYLKQQIVPTVMALTTAVSTSFLFNETITGSTSGATAVIWNNNVQGDALHLTLYKYNVSTGPTFVDGETITGKTSGVTAVIATNGVVVGNWDLQYLTTTDAITSVLRIFSVGSGGIGGSVNNIFDVVYQFRLTDMYDLLTTDLIYYQQMKQHLETLDMILPGQRMIRFNRKQNRIYIDCDWYSVFAPNDYVVAECYAITDPNQFSKVYDDMFLKRYATALIKRQWGSNLIKFNGIQLPGGVTLNGQNIYGQALEEIDKIETEMQLRYELPPAMQFG